MNIATAPTASLTLPVLSSALLHAVVLGFVMYRVAAPAKALPPLYRVELVAAPAGDRAAGVITDARAPEAPSRVPPAPETKRTTATKAAAKRAPKPAKAATPNVTPKSTPQKSVAPPKAGGGAQGGTGTDVANVLTAGIEFPFPGYLTNVVRQIALQFEVPPSAASLAAEVAFLIRRDGSVSAIRIISKSGSYVFDLSCVGAVEAAGRQKRFGPLPEGFSDDVLPVIFSFDPKRMR